MKKLLLTIVIIFGLHSPTVSAEPLDVQPAGVKTEDVAKIRNIILSQLDAFREDDAEKAFSFAAPQIQKIFKTPEIFLHMVRKIISVSIPAAVVRVSRHPAHRRKHRSTAGGYRPDRHVGNGAFYIMEEQPDGTWKIGGCIMAQEPGKNT